MLAASGGCRPLASIPISMAPSPSTRSSSSLQHAASYSTLMVPANFFWTLLFCAASSRDALSLWLAPARCARWNTRTAAGGDVIPREARVSVFF